MADERSMMHGREYTGQNITGWALCEKYDGCRAWWDGSRLWSRGGHVVRLPEELRAELPAGVVLDGELFREGLSPAHVSNIMRGRGSWNGMRFMVFDAPEAPGGYLDRLDAACKAIQGSTFAHAVQVKMNDAPGSELVNTWFREIRGRRGEGLIARNPSAPYRAGRSGAVLKIKQCIDMR